MVLLKRYNKKNFNKFEKKRYSKFEKKNSKFG